MKGSVLTGNPERKAPAWQGTLNESLRVDREHEMKASGLSRMKPTRYNAHIPSSDACNIITLFCEKDTGRTIAFKENTLRITWSIKLKFA